MTKAVPKACRIALVTLGGTIAAVPSGDSGATPSLDAAALAASVPGIEEVGAIELVSFRTIPGAHLRSADLIALAKLAGRLAEEGVAGIVITQGTDTIEETAFALDLLTGDKIPIVVTGAMRGPTEVGADGPANILNAVRVAVSGSASGLGVVVLMDDTLHAARWVRKGHTSRPSAFVSPNTGPIGWVTEGRVTIATQPRRKTFIDGVSADINARVALVSTWLGDDGHLVTAAADHYEAIVVQATGGGHVNPAVAEAIGAAASRLPVVFSSRVGAGETLRCTYGFPGSERDLIQRGAIPAGSLDAAKARLILELLLSRTGRSSVDAVRDFNIYSCD